MPRKIVPMEVGEMYHVYNRGVDKREIFRDSNDYLRFYRSLHLFNSLEPIVNFKIANHLDNTNTARLVDIHAYALLPNHYHLLIKQVAENGVSEFMKRVSGGYTSYFNERYDRSGVLFQGKYKRVHVDSDDQYRYLFAYVNENSVVHNIARPDEIMYTSSPHYRGISQSKLISITCPYNYVEARELALEIYNKRQQMKYTVIEE